MYFKLKKEFGNRVTYAQSPKSHVMVEFSFDVVQVAAAAYAPEAYHSFIGFQVAKRLLERAFSETYGIEMKEIFFNENLAIGTYRHAVGTTIPEMTKVAWEKKHDEIQKVIPSARREAIVFNLSGRQYDETFGTDYETPHGFARFLGWMYKLIPKIGPFRAFSYSVPTLADWKFAGVPDGLRSNILAYYRDAGSLPAGTKAQRARSARIRQQLAQLKAVTQP